MREPSYIDQKQLVYGLVESLHKFVQSIPLEQRIDYRNLLVELNKQLEQLTETEWKDNSYGQKNEYYYNPSFLGPFGATAEHKD